MRVLMLLGLATLTVSACDVPGPNGTQSSGALIRTVPDGVREVAAPFQDLTAVRINPNDGCYEYRYSGPVETTFLPLRTKNGNPICSQ
ncbi:MAG: hypothetical protein AB8B51_12600 [Sedimentitalea sp.]